MLLGLAISQTLPTLMVGSPAPPFLVRKWVKGEPLNDAPHTGLVVLEFWRRGAAPASRASLS